MLSDNESCDTSILVLQSHSRHSECRVCKKRLRQQRKRYGRQNLDAFIPLIKYVVTANGLPNADVHCHGTLLTLPGFYRPTKRWDILIMSQGQLVAAIEMKSQVGSFGNNFNNRAEEAIGSASDFWVAFREGALGKQPLPFLGWMMLVEKCQKSKQPVKMEEPHFRTFPEFKGTSYLERYGLLCEKLVIERQYTAATAICAERDCNDYDNLSETCSLDNFLIRLAGHIAECAARSSVLTYSGQASEK